MHWEREKEKEWAKGKEEPRDIVGRVDSWGTNSGNAPKEKVKEERSTKDQEKAPSSEAAGRAVETTTKQSAPREKERAQKDLEKASRRTR